MKIASWFLALTLGALLVYTSAQIPPEAGSALSFHLSSRYTQPSAESQGFGSQVGSVLADYRSLDLLIFTALCFVIALSLILILSNAPRLKLIVPAFLGWIGMCLALGVGVLGLLYGSNFLDYEVLAFWAPPSQARVNGVLILTGAALLSLGGLLLLFFRWVQTSEDSRER